MSKFDHIDTIIQNRESWIQTIWAHQSFSKNRLSGIDKEKITILFQGWINKGAGPDFSDAQILLDNNKYYGAIEIHLKSSDWYKHKHHLDPAYNAVVLHVILDCDISKPIVREDHISVPQLELRPILKKKNLSLLEDKQDLLEQYDKVPGKCGLLISKWNIKSITNILGHAAENRIHNKVDRISTQWNRHGAEQLLFQHLFKTLGYRAYSHSFEELAQLYPLSSLSPLFQLPYRAARTAIIARWFGSCGLLSKNIPIIKHSTLRREYHQWYEEWQQIPNPTYVAHKFKQPFRPQNSPERRLIGMFHHLYFINSEGLLKGWLNLLIQLAKIGTEEKLKKEALLCTQQFFDTPDWELWQSFFSLSSHQNAKQIQLIGKDRQIIIWANVIIPFFLVYARKENLLDLEKLLYRLFIVLPPEADNQKTRFMKKRLFPLDIKNFHSKTLRIQQGLIQIHHDFCQNFDQGCLQCEIIPLMEKHDKENSHQR